MTPDEREQRMEAVGDRLVLILEEAVENLTAVVFGKKRLAVVPRRHPKVKEGPIYELRLVKVHEPEVVIAKPADAGLLTPEELEQI